MCETKYHLKTALKFKVDRMPVASVPEENMLHTFEKKSKATTKI